MGRSRAKSSRFLTMAEQRCVSRSMSARFRCSAARCASSGGPSASVRETSFREGEDACERVVDLVGDRGGELAERGELLGADELLLGLAEVARARLHLALEPGEHARELVLEPPEGAGHLVEGAGEEPELAARVHADLDVEIVARDAARPLEQRRDRLDHLGPAEQEEERGEDEHRRREHHDEPAPEREHVRVERRERDAVARRAGAPLLPDELTDVGRGGGEDDPPLLVEGCGRARSPRARRRARGLRTRARGGHRASPAARSSG